MVSVTSNIDKERKLSAKKMGWILRCQKVDENSEELQKIWKHREKDSEGSNYFFKEQSESEKDNLLWEIFPTSNGISHCLHENGDTSTCSIKAADARLEPIPVLPEQQKIFNETLKEPGAWRASFEGMPLRLSKLITFQILIYGIQKNFKN